MQWLRRRMEAAHNIWFPPPSFAIATASSPSAADQNHRMHAAPWKKRNQRVVVTKAFQKGERNATASILGRSHCVAAINCRSKSPHDVAPRKRRCRCCACRKGERSDLVAVIFGYGGAVIAGWTWTGE
ncbi:putative sodium/hydrogen exchanger 3-like isoform X1 [Sesbania bispinosa]|nr:putative sodium/hydrogen exchanger 3-like isoform X1 [Sesbania bispinosa]